MFDLKNGLKAVRAISPVAIGTTGVGQVGKIIDRKGYIGPVMFAIEYGTVTATTAVYSVVVKEGDVTGALTSVADVDLIGTEVAAGLSATSARVSGTSKNCVKTIGYKGGKRYCNVSVRSTTTATTPIAASAFLDPASKPAA